MVFSVSPSVAFREVDLTSSVPAASSKQGAIAGVFSWGPVNEATLITSESELASIFGKPTNNNYETFFAAADFLSYSNQLYVVRASVGATAAIGFTQYTDLAADEFAAKYAGTLGNSIGVSFVAGATQYEQHLFDAGDMTEVVADTNIFNADTVTFTASTDISANLKIGDVIRIGNDNIGYQQLTLKATSMASSSGVYEYSMTFDSKIMLAETDINYLSMSRSWRYTSIVGKPPATNACHIVVTDLSGDISGNVGTILERYVDVSFVPGATKDDGSNNYYKDVINASSSWIRTDSDSLSIANNGISYIALKTGTDGLSETGASFSSISLAYDVFKNSDEYDIAFIIQGKANSGPSLANYIIGNICEVRKDCVLFISPSRESIIVSGNVITSKNTILNNILTFRNNLQSSSYWFMDTGYKYRYDKYNDTYRWVPLNGDIAGLAARVDPWESIAGYKRGIIKNVVKLAFNPDKAFRDVLYAKDVNSVVSQLGQGTLLLGDKTGIGRSSAFDRINVRRLFIVVEKAVANASVSILFDLNNDFTQTEFRNTIEPFLRDIKGKGGIYDYTVVCDSRVNTPDVIDSNTFRSNIFMKPARTINFIELAFVATRTGISFEEIVGQQF